MDLERANTIPISEILSKLDLNPVHQEGPTLQYRSLWDRKLGAILIVDTASNRWSDASTREGTLVDWVIHYLKFRLEAHTQVDAVRWITNMSVSFSDPIASSFEQEPAIVLRQQKRIQYPGLLHYLKREGISLNLAAQHLKEVYARNRQTGKDFIALGLPTLEGGFALRTAYLERFIGLPAISFIRGRTPKPQSLHLFKESFDYLALLDQMNLPTLDGDVIILNAWSCLSQVSPYIRHYGYQTAYSWLDNTNLGNQAMTSFDTFLQTEAGIRHQPMNNLYKDHDSVHAWCRHKLSLAKKGL